MGKPKIIIGSGIFEQGIAWADMLESLGSFSVVRRMFGHSILEKISDDKPDIVIIESRMPDMTVAEFMDKLRELCLSCPIVIALGDGENQDTEEVYSAGVSGFIQRPFTPRELDKFVRDILRANGILPEGPEPV